MKPQADNMENLQLAIPKVRSSVSWTFTAVVIIVSLFISSLLAWLLSGILIVALVWCLEKMRPELGTEDLRTQLKIKMAIAITIALISSYRIFAWLF